jgi:hypothetical protein
MKRMRKIRLFQKDAYIGIDFLNKKTEVIKLKSDTDVDAFTFDIETPLGKKTIAMSNPAIPEVNAIKMELETFRDCILYNTAPIVTVVDGYRAMDVAHQILNKIKIHPQTLNAVNGIS